MCGIVGYIGDRPAAPLLLEGLKRLEYRGYDSSGLAVLDNSITCYKRVGRISSLTGIVPQELNQTVGIAHTRWATHGGVSDANAHPHLSRNKKFAIVHNGIIENYIYLKNMLAKAGFAFSSQTDSEVIAHLLEKNYEESGTHDFEEAFNATLRMLEGTYGLVAMCSDHPDCLMVARKGSPLVLGIGNNEMFVASDVSAFLGHTDSVVYLDDYEIAKVTATSFQTKDFRLEPTEKAVSKIEWQPDSLDLNGFPHYMLKEIFEQPESIERGYAGRIVETMGTTKLGGLNLTPAELFAIKRVCIIACGTSYHAGLVGAYIIEELARIPTRVEIASEFKSKNPIIEDGTLYFAVSQSGETIDTLLSMREIQRKGGKVLGICNVVGSTIPRESNGGVYVHSGPEIAVASTKAFTSQLIVLTLFAVMMARMKDMSLNTGKRLINDIKKIPDCIRTILGQAAHIESIAGRLKDAQYFMFLGRGISYPVALEGALKLKEVSYILSEGIPAGEIKHGPIALIDKTTPVIFIIPNDDQFDKTLSNMQEVRSRGGIIITIYTECAADSEIYDKLKSLSDEMIPVPNIDASLTPLLTIIPLQLLAYYIARDKGCDIDKPRNLAKSVTVE
ncbi:MAG: glutamine--fructose-6-phosphate transaminase (isomerizing) [Spirochaetales bacterium]|nr:glutamine--fructose-6-phosphate transaminase (isomerizing) [Spirochaetales bacterium]